jgi:hypothetical protein
MFFFAIVFPFACPDPNSEDGDDANRNTDVKNGFAILALPDGRLMYSEKPSRASLQKGWRQCHRGNPSPSAATVPRPPTSRPLNWNVDELQKNND